MAVLGILSLKGGSGKTTLVSNLAHGLARTSKDVYVIDADTQATAWSWALVDTHPSDSPEPPGFVREHERYSWPEAVNVVPMSNPSGLKRILGAYMDEHGDAVRAGKRHVIIDGPPRLLDTVGTILDVVTHLLVPLQPSGADLWANEPLMDLLATRPHIQTMAVVCRSITGTRMARSFKTNVGNVLELDCARNVITQRIAYAEALSFGTSVFQYEPRGEAASEMRRLTNEIRRWLERKDALPI